MSAVYAAPVSIEQLHESLRTVIDELRALDTALDAEHTTAVDQLIERAAYVVRLETALRLIAGWRPGLFGVGMTPQEIARRALEAIPPRMPTPTEGT